ncbi:MAG: GNAT family N-acetyltransferase [Anaerolineae bacterium]|nr:GNAT family N-acetyltransferase [Anaerolineae bacterium]
MTQPQPPIALPGGLVLRFARPDDMERIADFNRALHPDPGEPERIGAMLYAWTMDLGNGKHPTTAAEHFTLVEDPAAGGKLVSTMCVIPQTWVYEGIPYGMGRIELVGTDPDYRNRGLIRAQFEQLHAWCAAHDAPVQGITGIPYFYRQFGYEMTLNLGGARSGSELTLPLKHEGDEPYRFRAATLEDIPLLMQLEREAARRAVTTVQRDAAQWRYELLERSPDNIYARTIAIIEDTAGERIGFLVHPPELWGSAMGLNRMELLAGVNWGAVLPTVIRHLWQLGQGFAAQAGGDAACKSVRFSFGGAHPAYPLVEQWLPTFNAPYCWYLRVADVPAFLRQIAPALEARLAASVHAGYSGEIKVNMYTGGLRLRFEGGTMVESAPWRPTREDNGQARFPAHTFLHLLFGHRTSDEINHLYADAGVDTGHKDLLTTLFPKKIGEDTWALA